MTIIQLAAVGLKNASHLHGLTSTSSTIKTNDRVKAVLILESGLVIIVSQAKDKSGPKAYLVHSSDTFFTEPVDAAWASKLVQLEPPASPKEVPTDPARPSVISSAKKL